MKKRKDNKWKWREVKKWSEGRKKRRERRRKRGK